MAKLSNQMDKIIKNSVKTIFDNKYDANKYPESSFEELISLGELVDRLTIVNIKLFKVKDIQQNSDSNEVLADLAKLDVRLCKERARLKACIDEKLIKIIKKVIDGDKDGGFNKEVKSYG